MKTIETIQIYIREYRLRRSWRCLKYEKPGIQITLIDQKGTKGCHRGHKIGDSFDFDTERGKLCPMAMHVAFPYIDILRYGGEIPGQEKGTAVLPALMWTH